ncbi:vitamin B12 dependent-methionine synthase activation domain-containing protein [Planctomycetota bacterium]
MSPDAKTFEVATDVFAYDPLEATRLLGYQGAPPESVNKTLTELFQEALPHIEAVCGYRWIQESIAIETDCFTCQDVTFNCGARIGRHLKASTGIACFVATLGLAFEEWSKGFFKQDDPYQGYLSDTIGSVLVESVADWLEQQLQDELHTHELKRTNRVSPGYCQWPVAEQHKLFGFFPKGFCGITLTDSSLMVPMKSISGVMGTGPDVKRRDYACNICDMVNCMMRRH